MKSKLTDESRNSKDHGIIIACLLLLIAAAIPLVSPDVFNRLFVKETAASSGPKIGKIISMKNDIRQKNPNSFAWKNLAGKENQVSIGDSIFSGAGSSTRIAMNDGSAIDLDENSLVTFSKTDDLKLADLSSGRFRISVNGAMNVRIQGQLVKIEGHDSEVQIVLSEKGPPEMRLLKGQAFFQTEDGRRMALTDKASPIYAEVPEPAPRVDLPSQLTRIDRWDDFYEENGAGLRKLQTRHELVSFDLSVRSNPANAAHLAQLSAQADFHLPSAVARRVGAEAPRFHKLFLGINFIRVSKDGRHWSAPEAVELSSESLKLTPPQLKISARERLPLLESVATLKIDAPAHFSRTILEISNSAEFPLAGTRVEWIPAEGLHWSFREEQTLYIRARGVNELDQITSSGQIQRIDIVRPPDPSLPRLAMHEIHMIEQQMRWIEWTGGSRYTQLTLLTSQGSHLQSYQVKTNSFQLPALPAGEYQLRISATDEFGRSTRNVRVLPVLVKKAETPLFLAAEPVPQRQIAAVSESRVEVEKSVPTYLNRHYADSRLALEGSAFTVFSQPQVDRGVESPTALTGGVRGMHWWDHHGVEAALKVKVTSLKESADGGIAPLQMEARYHYRFTLPFSPFSGLGSSQISVFNGFEFYRNPVQGPFSPGYDLLKVGTALTFPFISRWDTGGELVYGHGFDQSKKYEVSGFLSYYFDTQFSFGIGYRAHLFNAGSTASSPKELPYREAFGEGYSVMRWTY